MPALKSLVRGLLHAFDVDIVRHSHLIRLELAARAEADLTFLGALPEEALVRALAALPESQSQLRQDIFVLSQCGFKQAGYFVEFGATDGKTLSNTWLLEKQFGWSGILAEPGRRWHEHLLIERSARIDTDCVWSQSGARLEFIEAAEAELSTLASHASGDEHARSRRNGRHYQVNTITLNDLLARHQAPSQIDYLSIDTEGSEFEILNALDFDSYSFAAITCEHNFTSNREKIYALLSGHGYVRKFEEISRFDDWFVRVQ